MENEINNIHVSRDWLYTKVSFGNVQVFTFVLLVLYKCTAVWLVVDEIFEPGVHVYTSVLIYHIMVTYCVRRLDNYDWSLRREVHVYTGLWIIVCIYIHSTCVHWISICIYTRSTCVN